MKFSFTNQGQNRQRIMILNEQKVFDSVWNINKPKHEITISLNLDVPGRPISEHKATEIMYQYLSDKKRKLSLLNIIGIYETKLSLRVNEFNALLKITGERLEKGYEYATWLDVLMLLFILEYMDVYKNMDLYMWATSQQNSLIMKNEDIVPYLKVLSNDKIHYTFKRLDSYD